MQAIKERKLAIINIAQSDNNVPLSKAKQEFNKLIKQIDSQKLELSAWQDIIPQYQHIYDAEVTPLLEQLEDLKEKLAYVLDAAYNNKSLTKTERLKIQDIICNIVSGLSKIEQDKSLKALYDKYSDSSFDQEKAGIYADFRDFTKEMFDIELDENMESTEDVFADVMKKMYQKFTEEEQKEEENLKKAKPRKKSAKALAKEAAKAKEEQEVSASIKSVYRCLAATLHPDKEQDLEERERKTQLMQEVNVAYNKKDLLALLELQMQVEQIDQESVNNITDEKIKNYNKILKEQLSELKDEIEYIKQAFSMRFDTYMPYMFLTTKNLMTNINYEKSIINQEINTIAEDLDLFGDIKNLKRALKRRFG